MMSFVGVGNSGTSPAEKSTDERNGSTTGFGDAAKRKSVVIWPEWNDADISAEKWDAATHGKDKKEVKDKGGAKTAAATPVQQAVHLFEDPEGRCELPPSLLACEWKRPTDFITGVEKPPVVVDIESMNSFDLMPANDVVHESETMRWITSQITCLWKMSEIKYGEGGPLMFDPNNLQESMFTHSWRPWEHIYALGKTSAKGASVINQPQFNPYGKYVVKLFFMGCWRKVTIDDLMPFDGAGNLLLPSTALRHELWPMLLTKALLKVAALDYQSCGCSCEFGDFSTIHCLTGWLPEIIPLKSEYMENTWMLLKLALPEFKLPDVSVSQSLDDQPRASMDGSHAKDDKTDKDRHDKEKGDKDKGRESKRDVKGKDDKKKKGEKDDRDKMKMNAVPEEPVVPDHPGMIVFATYHSIPKIPTHMAKLTELADAFEMMRQHGLAHCYSHPVLLTQTRSCPLEPPPPPEKIPAWKMVRPRINPDACCGCKEPEKPIQSVHITSQFLNYRLPFAEAEDCETAACKPCEDQKASDGLSKTDAQKLPSKSNEIQKIIEEERAIDNTEKAGSPKKKKTKETLQEPSSPEKRQLSSKASKRSTSAMKMPELKGSNDAKSPTKSGDPKKDGRMTSTENQPNTETQAVNEETDGSAEIAKEEEPEVKVKVTETWMDFNVLCQCFKTLHVYHKPNTYPCSHKQSDLKSPQQPVVAPVKQEKKGAAPAVTVTPQEEKSPYYLFVDNLKPTEIVVSFSALCHWNEAVVPPAKEETKPQVKGVKEKGDRESRMGDTISNEIVIPVDPPSTAVVAENLPKEPLQPGLLVAEPFSWKSLAVGQPVLRLRTTGTRATALCLPEGRHVLRLSVTAPLGYQLHLLSTVNFVFGDEEKVMAELTKESCLFLEYGTHTMKIFGKCLTNFYNAECRICAHSEFEACHRPYQPDRILTIRKHTEVLNSAIYTSIKKVLQDAQVANPETSFALRVLTLDFSTPNPLGLAFGAISRPATGVTTIERAPSSVGKKGALPLKKREVVENKADNWKNREPTVEEVSAATTIASFWRSYYVRKILRARIPGSEECAKVQEQLVKVWAAIEPNAESCGSMFMRTMFRLHPQIVPAFAFSNDEWSRISYADYSGSYTEHPPNTWFVVFREVFTVSEEMLCVPKITTSLPSCALRVINNDTREEIPRVFLKVAPFFYKPNKYGYTFLAEGRSSHVQSNSGQWRLRLIGSASPLPAPLRNDTIASFNVLELRDYYVPNENYIILRYMVKVSEDHLATIQLSTSKPDVKFRLSVFDFDCEVACCEGRGHAILPAFIFQKEPAPANSEDDTCNIGRSVSRASIRSSKRRGSSATRISSAEKKGSSSKCDTATDRERGPPSRSQSRQSLLTECTRGQDAVPHKYCIQAVVLQQTWPLSQSQWAFVQTLKENQLNEQKVEVSPSQVRGSMISKGKEKQGAKGSKTAAKEKSSESAAVSLNINMPNWTLRIVSDADAADTIEVKKDAERVDSIRAMKLAWEEAEPGRAAKAKQSRLNYLNSHTIKCDGDEAPTEEVHSEEGHSEEDGQYVSLATSKTGSLTTSKAGSLTTSKAGSVITSKAGSATTSKASNVNVDPTTPMPSLTVLPVPVPTTDEDDSILTNEPPPVKKPQEVLLPLDLGPFLRKTTDVPRLLDEAECDRQLEQKRAEIQVYRQWRSDLAERRERDRKLRNALKCIQLQLCEQMQVTLDAARAAINEPREAFRQRLIEEEKWRLEELAAQEAALKAEFEKNNPSPKGQKAARSPVGKKKK